MPMLNFGWVPHAASIPRGDPEMHTKHVWLCSRVGMSVACIPLRLIQCRCGSVRFVRILADRGHIWSDDIKLLIQVRFRSRVNSEAQAQLVLSRAWDRHGSGPGLSVNGPMTTCCSLTSTFSVCCLQNNGGL